MSRLQRPWALVIFACRESVQQLRQTLDAALVPGASCAVIHVLVNGNQTLADALAEDLTRQPVSTTVGPVIRLWSIPLGDKANAWNQSIHQLWAGEEIAFFIDGYVRLNADAVDLLGNAVTANVQALAGTGVPTMGRSAKELRASMIVHTGYHGNFCCIKGDSIRQMRDQQIRLPVGLYRTDSLMGAILCFGLDPGQHRWEDYRIHVHPTASWQIDPARWWRVRDLHAYLKRYFRQMRGKIENAAFADHLAKRKCTPATLPATVQELVTEWAERCPDDVVRLERKHFWIRKSLKSFQLAHRPSDESLKPQLVWQS